MMEAAVEAAAARFWEDAGREEAFPRGLEGSVSLALALRVVRLDSLSVELAHHWLAAQGLQAAGGDRPFAVANRSLQGFLFAWEGHGWIFVDASDHPDEQRFSLAHEAAHFLLDVLLPREQIWRGLGEDALDVVDGRRQPTMAERVDASLAGLALGAVTHLLERGPRGVEHGAVAESEARADRLALEILAPESVAVGLLADQGGWDERVDASAAAFVEGFGLPAPIARAYALRLLREREAGPGWRELLGGPRGQATAGATADFSRRPAGRLSAPPKKEHAS